MSVVSEEIKQQIRDLFPRYATKQACTLPALHLVHDEYRQVSEEAIKEIADLLDLSPAEVHDTMSFYHFFRTESCPLGKTRIWVCRSLACMLRGGEEVLSKMCEKLNTKPGQTTEDGQFSIEFGECLGICEGAPACLINDSARMEVTVDKIDGLLEELRKN